jgi:hypothetical protein
MSRYDYNSHISPFSDADRPMKFPKAGRWEEEERKAEKKKKKKKNKKKAAIFIFTI